MGVTVRPNASVALKLRIVFDDDKVISSDSGYLSGNGGGPSGGGPAVDGEQPIALNASTPICSAIAAIRKNSGFPLF